MKDTTALVWVTQLGFSTAIPLAGFILLSVWLQTRFSLGGWIIAVGVILGIAGAFGSLWRTLKNLLKLTEQKKSDPPPPVSFNEHY